MGHVPQAMIPDGLASSATAIPAVFPKATHLRCLFHHQQGVSRWLRDPAATLPETTVRALKQAMKAVVQRFYKTRGGVHSVVSAQRELMLFLVGYVVTIQPDTGQAPIACILPEAPVPLLSDRE